MSPMNFSCELTIVIPRLPCLFNMASAASSTVELVNSVTSNSVSSFNFVMCAFARKCLPIELVPCSDGWRRTWWQMIHMMPGLRVSSIPQCKQNCPEGACLEFFQAIEHFEPTFIQAHQASNTICSVQLFNSRIKTYSFLEDINTYSNQVFTDCESDMAVGIGWLGNWTWQDVNRYGIVEKIAGS